MSARDLSTLDYAELAAFLETNATGTAAHHSLEAVLDSLAARSGGKVRRLVTAMRATVGQLIPRRTVELMAEHAAADAMIADAKPKPRGRPRKAETVADAPAAPDTPPDRVIDPASLPHYVDPDDGREDRRDTPHPTVAELARDKVPTNAVRRRDPGLKHYSPPGIGYTREMKAGKAHDRRLAAAVLDATGLHVPASVSWIDHLRDCAARHGVSLRCSLIPAVTEAYREWEAPKPERPTLLRCPAEWHGVQVRPGWSRGEYVVSGGYKSAITLPSRIFASEADAWDAVEAIGLQRPEGAPVNVPDEPAEFAHAA